MTKSFCDRCGEARESYTRKATVVLVATTEKEMKDGKDLCATCLFDFYTFMGIPGYRPWKKEGANEKG